MALSNSNLVLNTCCSVVVDVGTGLLSPAPGVSKCKSILLQRHQCEFKQYCSVPSQLLATGLLAIGRSNSRSSCVTFSTISCSLDKICWFFNVFSKVISSNLISVDESVGNSSPSWPPLATPTSAVSRAALASLLNKCDTRSLSLRGELLLTELIAASCYTLTPTRTNSHSTGTTISTQLRFLCGYQRTSTKIYRDTNA
ncbi:unnamed protein product [Cyberlindnera jadinii]|uniref:Uncharacterized protein n=1 Tax=Cyberlindnera jadinii (strain ATCC 18201 / CBS 1600 / BCRC 20928 / JCM 3617 / NBRC 0987 / NRRL Y-1542) TaxID=983966 RepID=A0A0H5C5H4_CYBJN|nr:unnamed protein product [Cyberlindnera jadinii]